MQSLQLIVPLPNHSTHLFSVDRRIPTQMNTWNWKIESYHRIRNGTKWNFHYQRSRFHPWKVMRFVFPVWDQFNSRNYKALPLMVFFFLLNYGSDFFFIIQLNFLYSVYSSEGVTGHRTEGSDTILYQVSQFSEKDTCF